MQSDQYTLRDVEGGAPLKLWTQGVHLAENALQQLESTARLPIIFGHIAVMPDVHYGKGATIGSVIATKGAIIPAAVGVDIGCGMQAVQTDLHKDQLQGRWDEVRRAIERAIPHGRSRRGGRGDRGAWGNLPDAVQSAWDKRDLGKRYALITSDDAELKTPNNVCHLGTLGTGNHFIEICFDRGDRIWLMLHSGSRGPGARIADAFMARAAKEARAKNLNLPHADLAYLSEGTESFERYICAMLWAQDFAKANRDLMMDNALNVLRSITDFSITFRHDCHHNFSSLETHFGESVWVTRKGATRARHGEWGIIPGSMGTGSYIVQGLGNSESYSSCSHGAGRMMSRTVARGMITMQEHAQAMSGIECRLDKAVLDESPAAYKDLESVIAAQTDLIKPIYQLQQLINVKG